jgi:PAS domain S-box-containing protein
LEQIVDERTAELRTAFRYARNLLEASLDPLATISPGGQITDVNKATETATGVAREQLIGSDFSAYFTDPEKADEVYRTVLSRGLVTDYPLTIRHASGSTIDVLYNAAVYRNEAGDVQGVFAAARDVTEHNRMDKELQVLHEALEHRAAQLQSLASDLTLTEHRERRRLAQLLHDHLQQLLYAARLSVTTLRRRVCNKDLQNMIQHLDTLLGQCIEESRSVTMELSPPVLYDAGLVEALEWLSRQIQLNYGLSVEVESDVQAEPEAEDIKVLLFQSVRELLFNVVKHAGAQNASIKMSLTPDQQVRIDVVDKGVGFNVEHIQAGANHIAGFGLFSIRERLELMGGRLEVQTAAGEGTRASIFAPYHWQQSAVDDGTAVERSMDGTPELAATDESVTPPSRRIRVLLADDHTILRKGLLGVLNQEADIEVVAEAADGEMAIELTRQFNPDVVLIEATRRIIALQPSVGIIGFSAHKEEDMARALYKAGAIGYLSKDEPAELLIAAIRNVLSGSADARLNGRD